MKLSFAPALAPILSFAIICAISCDPTTGLPVYAASTSEVSVNRTLDDLEQAISDRRLKQNDIETLAEIVQAHPTDYRAHLLFGLALDEIGMAEQALEQFRLADKYGAEALNLTCKRCLFYEDYRMSTIKRILDKKLYHAPLEDEVMVKAMGSSKEGLSFIRPPKYFIHTEEELS